MENEQKKKKEIKRELISKDLTKYLKLFIPVILLCILFGYIGYVYSKDNNEDLGRGIIIGAIYPLGIMLIKLLDEISYTQSGVFIYIIYTIIWICISGDIPFWVGVVILFSIILFFIIWFIYIEIKDRTDEVNKIYEKEISNQRRANIIERNNTAEYNTNQKYKPVENIRGAFDDSGVYISPDELESMEKAGMITKETNIIEENEEPEYECEMCFKKISYEEWETYDMMCEDCFMDLHIDDDGNYHDNPKY